MKLLIHCKITDLIQILKICVTSENVDIYNLVEPSDYIYIFNDVYDNTQKIKYHHEKLKDEISILMRRQFYVQVCVIEGCDCNGLKTEIDDVKDMVFTSGYRINMNKKKQIKRKEGWKVSGFGYYMRDMLIRIQGLYANEKQINVHGCEYETVKLKIENKLDNLILFGLPEIEDDEFVLEEELVASKLAKDALKIKYLNNLTIREFIISRDMYVKKDYMQISSDESYNIHKDKYPEPFNNYSLRVGFKYSTYKVFEEEFKKLFFKGVTLLDLGSGFLYKFLIDSGVDVVVPLSEDRTYCKMQVRTGSNPYCIISDPLWIEVEVKGLDIFINTTKGYVNRYIILPVKDYKDGRLRLILQGRAFGLYKIIVGYKPVTSIEELRSRQFRSYYERGLIIPLDMFKDKSENLKIAFFCVSNSRNFKQFKASKKFENGILHGRQIVMMISAEAYGIMRQINIDSRRPRVKEYKDAEDYCVYNIEISKRKLDFISVKDLEVRLYPQKYNPKLKIAFDIVNERTYYYGICTNEFTSGTQNVITSDTMNKSISTAIKMSFSLGETALHELRFTLLKGMMRAEDLKYHEKDMWSLSYYIDKKTNKYKFCDVSGHVINLILRSSRQITNFNGYIRMKKLNLKMLEMNEVGIMERDTENYLNGENRGKQKDELWHTAQEDYQACSIAWMLLKHFSFPCVDTKYIRKLFDELVYPKGKLSIPVVHDQGIYNGQLNLTSYE